MGHAFMHSDNKNEGLEVIHHAPREEVRTECARQFVRYCAKLLIVPVWFGEHTRG